MGTMPLKRALRNSQAGTLQLTFGNVASQSEAPGTRLALYGRPPRPESVRRELFDNDDTEAFVITKVLQSAEIIVSAKDEHGGEVEAGVPAIKAILGANVSWPPRRDQRSDHLLGVRPP